MPEIAPRSPNLPRWWGATALSSSITLALFFAKPFYDRWAGTVTDPIDYATKGLALLFLVNLAYTAGASVKWRRISIQVQEWAAWLKRFREHAVTGGFTTVTLDPSSMIYRPSKRARIKIQIRTQSPVPLRYGDMRCGRISMMQAPGMGLTTAEGVALTVKSFAPGDEAPDLIEAFCVVAVPYPPDHYTHITLENITIVMCDESGIPTRDRLHLQPLSAVILVSEDAIR